MGGIFSVVLRSPLGPRAGTLALYQNGAVLQGKLTFFGMDNPIAEGTVSGKQYTFSGSITTAAGVREYKAIATIDNGVLNGEMVFYLRTVPVKIPLPVPMKLTGKRIKESGR